MAEEFDIGPLTWVKDEVNQALDTVLDSLKAVQKNVHDLAPLRFAKTHLYQAAGALDMVGLQGCTRFCNELESLAGKLEKGEIAINDQLAENFISAIVTLKAYIQDLLNGAPDIPLRLHSVLKPLAEVQGNALDESELFFPDTSNSAPKDLPTKHLNDADYAKYVVEQRLDYQKSLLNWLQTKQAKAIESMTNAVHNVCEVQEKSNSRTLWWAASAFTETLEHPVIAENPGAKRLCRKLDQELKLLSEGINKPHSNLLRDVLYYVAISDMDKPLIARVKEVFELDSLIERQDSVRFNAASIDDSEMEVVRQLLQELDNLREIWGEVSNAIDFDKIDSDDSRTQINIDNVLITKFADALYQCQSKVQSLSQVVVVDLYGALQQAINTLRDDAAKVNQVALIEIAAALHLADDSLEHYRELDADRIQKLLSEISRLEEITTGIGEYKIAPERAGELDRDTVQAVTTQIKDALKAIEQALDTFFRNPDDKATLSVVAPHIKQVASVFDMLNMAAPRQIVRTSGALIEYFQQDGYQPDTTQFELVAESLSMVGLYTDELPKPRPLSEMAIDSASQRMVSLLNSLGLSITEPEAPMNVGNVLAEVNQDKANPQANTDPLPTPQTASGPTILDKALDDELLDIYLTEAEEVLAHIAQNLQALKVNETDHEALVEVRRSYHTLKGSGRTVGLAALGELAGKVEFFFNDVLDRKTTLNPAQISEIEQITSAFAGWAAELRSLNQVEVPQADWLERIAQLPNAGQQKTDQEAPKEEYVLIGGTRKIGRALFDIFVNESGQNVTKLELDCAKLNKGELSKPSTIARHAVHTLGSNALAAEFNQLGELARALESWLDEAVQWTPQHSELYTSAIQAISGMWQKITEQKSPRAAKSLVKVLVDATEQARANQAPNLSDISMHEFGLDGFDEVAEPFDAADTVQTPAEVILEEAVDTGVSVEEITLDEMTAAEADTDTSSVDLAGIEDVLGEPESSDIELKLATGSRTVGHGDKLARDGVNPELLTMFIEEAQELVPEIGTELRAWRASPRAEAPPAALQRSLHTLKGSARMAGQMELGEVVHEFEELVIRAHKQHATSADFDAMFVDLDKVAGFFEETKEQAPQEVTDDVVKDDVAPTGRSTDRKAQFLRMRADTLDRLINEAGEVAIIRSRMDREVLGFKQSSSDLTESLGRLRGYLRELEIEAETQMQSRMSILQEANQDFDPLEFDRFTRLQELTRMIAESVNDVSTIQQNMLLSVGQTEAALQQQNRMNRDLQQGLLGVRMLPFTQITERLQRIVRQTARELKKSVELEITGDSTEIDRSVLDKLGAPLEHLLRNAVAHGIEMPEERKKKGKPEFGTIKLHVAQQNDEIRLTVTDDGAGVNLDKVRDKAIKNGVIQEDAEITEQALLSVIFEPGFSTADKTTQIAGRGVGLDVVRNDISGLGGRVDLSSEFGKGTTFNVHLPVTLSVAQVLMVRSGNQSYALPVAMIELAQKTKRADLAKLYADGHVLWSDRQYPLHYLAKLLQQDVEPEDQAYTSVLLLRSGSHQVALHVDEVLGNQEVVMKTIGVQLARVPGIVGATVAGDGHIVLIINPVQIANREILAVGSVVVKTKKKAEVKKAVGKIRAMVVDDSLTMRKVLGRVLERAGYEVITAKDGMDAMQLLQEITPDVILTDIEMPRMDGFGLSRNIRDDARTANTPLIMISSRTADKHQNAAREIGVDWFFGKPVQDEELLNKVSELLENKRVLH